MSTDFEGVCQFVTQKYVSTCYAAHAQCLSPSHDGVQSVAYRYSDLFFHWKSYVPLKSYTCRDGLILAAYQMPTQLLSHSTSSTRQEKKIRWKNSLVEIKKRKSVTSCYHVQNTLDLWKINLIYFQLKQSWLHSFILNCFSSHSHTGWWWMCSCGQSVTVPLLLLLFNFFLLPQHGSF